MKSLILLFIGTFISISANAKETDQPDILCVEESGFLYEFYMGHQEVHIYDENGAWVGDVDGIYFDTKHLESIPAKVQYRVRYADDNSDYAVITFTDGKDFGTGEITDNDQSMDCIQ